MATINDGGPAFPSPAVYDPSREQVHAASAYGADPGMTLRDYFAAHAPEVPADFDWANMECNIVERLVRWKWHYADAMLKARDAR